MSGLRANSTNQWSSASRHSLRGSTGEDLVAGRLPPEGVPNRPGTGLASR